MEEYLILFYWLNPSGRTMTLASIQTSTEITARDVYWAVKVAGRRADNLTTFMCRLPRNSVSLKLSEPQGDSLRHLISGLQNWLLKIVSNDPIVNKYRQTQLHHLIPFPGETLSSCNARFNFVFSVGILQEFKILWSLKMEPIGFPETSVRNCQ
jgi:hypothetical protein